jgi:hypothetical protein
MAGTVRPQRISAVNRRAEILAARWQELCLKYLPLAPENSIWRYHAPMSSGQPACGWKLHVSATVLNAPSVLDRIAPLLIARGASFKAPHSLVEIGKLNSGLEYQYSQVGKIITVYPRTETEAVFLAKRLHRLTQDLAGPAVPFDSRFGDTSNVYYRYGAFEHLEVKRWGRKISAMRGPDGVLVPDIREQAKPDWVADPFQRRKSSPRSKMTSPLRVVKVLSQRGKGGVYVAIDSRLHLPRLCLLKEGRKNGETSWDGRDGAWSVKNEKRVLSRLSATGVAVPRVLSSYELGGNFYLLIEFVDGQTLHAKLLSLSRRLSVTRIVDYGIQLAQFIQQLHRAGWCWRDCKPKNIMVTPAGRLVPIDFEGASPIARPASWRWGTPGFSRPGSSASGTGNGVADDDTFALGAVLFLLLTGKVYDPHQPLSIHKLRRNVPPSLSALVSRLLAVSNDAGAEIESTIAQLILISQKPKPE